LANGLPVTGIGAFVFANFTSMTSVLIPGSVTNIGQEAFEFCSGLRRAYFEGNAPALGPIIFNQDSLTAYYLPGATNYAVLTGGYATFKELTAITLTPNPTNGVVPLTVGFTSAGVDSAGNGINNWNWTFGDGSTSTAQNPSHTYTIPGTFSPALVATNNLGRAVAGSGTASIRATVGLVYSGLVLNGGFETGDFTGWTFSGDTNGPFVATFIYGNGSVVAPHSGNYMAILVTTNGLLGYLSQTLATTAGAAYSLSLWLYSPDGLTPNEFLVSWNGNTLFDDKNIPISSGWINPQFSVSATGTNTVLEFGFRDPPSFFLLDDISVVPTQPGIASLSLSATNLVLNGINGQSGGTYYLLTSANLTLPLSQWMPVATNVLSASGNFTITAANAATGSTPQRFYILQTH
jgi:PKD repeat protein